MKSKLDLVRHFSCACAARTITEHCRRLPARVETEQTGTKKKEERDELRLHLGWARVGFIRIKSMRGPGEKRFIGKHLIIIICFEICAILKKRGVLKQFSKKNYSYLHVTFRAMYWTCFCNILQKESNISLLKRMRLSNDRGYDDIR